MRTEKKSFRKISKSLKVPTSTVRYLLLHDPYRKKRKPGRKQLLNKTYCRRIDTVVKQIKRKSQRISVPKIRQKIQIPGSDKTVRASLHKYGYHYGQVKSRIYLMPHHRQKRIEFAYFFYKNRINVDHIVFTDEKTFTLDGPPNTRTWHRRGETPTKEARVKGAGSINVLGFVMSCGVVGLFWKVGNLNSVEYIKYLDNYLLRSVTYVMEHTNMPTFVLQQDNAGFHTSYLTMEFLKDRGVMTLDWPAKSPDLNIMENIWKMLSDIVYDGPQINTKEELWGRILYAADRINIDTIRSLYSTFGDRLDNIIWNAGGIISHSYIQNET